jgi:hypothetical protein
MKWISVKDRLPNKDLQVLVYCIGISIRKWGFQRSKYINIEFWHNGDKRFCLYKKEWWDSGLFWAERNVCKITHWMFLPKPPKEKKNENLKR